MRIAIVASSNPIHAYLETHLDGFVAAAEADGISVDTRISDMYEWTESDVNQAGKIWRTDPFDRARLLNDCYADDSIDAICDLSGGNLANEVLPHLNWHIIRANRKPFIGFSDVSVLVNTIAARGNPAVLWNPQNIVTRGAADLARIIRGEYCLPEVRHPADFPLPDLPIVGGNIRCYAKLAGTEFWPVTTAERLVVLETYRTGLVLAVTSLEHLAQAGAFAGASGIILGQATKIDDAGDRPWLVKHVAGLTGLPVWEAPAVGHSSDAEPVTISYPARVVD